MTSLHASYIIDSEKKDDLVEQQNLTKSIFSIVLEFCSPEDICQFSACSRLFHKISKNFDYKFFYLYKQTFLYSPKNYE